ncbi:hypothetical protein RK945_02620 [Streptococcus pneumoniae]|uniref:Putative lipoprotein n=2 Tax=Streptococcus pneumoniae TaxID=1313 RepID=A0A4M9XQ68_STREE|nr:hypothetical protein [Streptococcus pneumoniae]MCW3741978.1 hypothetical protein [Burkholderia cenocepacia]MDS2238233.1 hypothetical protein [Streptococcus pneumoniae]MDS2249458.1 hypothetical protein [Streptococcus pneumoniae]MDS2257328.1 hypothetical protein [Streptococcus pneumoniae]MDS2279513.1 hypothetical protein [Streptococcus pneumoniae]
MNSKKIVPKTKTHTFDDVIEQGYCDRLSRYVPDAVVGGLHKYNSKDALPYAKKLKNTSNGKHLSVKYLASLLDMWDRACQLFHVITGTCLADDIFTSKKIHNESYFYNTNTSNFITDEVIDLVKEKHRSYSRKATPSNISLIEKELNYNSDLLYYYVNALGWKHFKRSYLVKCLAGAIA